MKSRKALFLDRDGTLIEERNYLCDPEEVVLLPTVREALRMALANHFHLFLLTNQSGVGRGLFSLKQVHACNDRMFSLLALPPPGFTEIGIAPEPPSAIPHYRKPSPRFPLEMIQKYHLNPDCCWVIGDQRSDWQTALNAGITPVALQTGQPITAEESSFLEKNHISIFGNLLKAISSILTGRQEARNKDP